MPKQISMQFYQEDPTGEDQPDVDLPIQFAAFYPQITLLEGWVIDHYDLEDGSLPPSEWFDNVDLRNPYVCKITVATAVDTGLDTADAMELIVMVDLGDVAMRIVFSSLPIKAPLIVHTEDVPEARRSFPEMVVNLMGGVTHHVNRLPIVKVGPHLSFGA
jgi:hypothetical protein